MATQQQKADAGSANRHGVNVTTVAVSNPVDTSAPGAGETTGAVDVSLAPIVCVNWALRKDQRRRQVRAELAADAALTGTYTWDATGTGETYDATAGSPADMAALVAGIVAAIEAGAWTVVESGVDGDGVGYIEAYKGASGTADYAWQGLSHATSTITNTADAILGNSTTCELLFRAAADLAYANDWDVATDAQESSGLAQYTFGASDARVSRTYYTELAGYLRPQFDESTIAKHASDDASVTARYGVTVTYGQDAP